MRSRSLARSGGEARATPNAKQVQLDEVHEDRACELLPRRRSTRGRAWSWFTDGGCDATAQLLTLGQCLPP